MARLRRVFDSIDRLGPPSLGHTVWINGRRLVMRIIAGTLKSRRLATPDFEGLRPTSDKLRETLFNVIAPRIQGAHVLDGFAGTGALGIEALSRGAAHVTFVDDDRRAIGLVGENVRRCGVADRCVIIRGRLVEVSGRLETAPFDLILLDPPYAEKDLVAAVKATSEVLAHDGLVVLEHARRCEAPEFAGNLARTRTLTSGDSVLTFYERGPERGTPNAAAALGTPKRRSRAGNPDRVRNDGQ